MYDVGWYVIWEKRGVADRERTRCAVFWSDELQSSSCTFCPDSGCIASADAVLVCCREAFMRLLDPPSTCDRRSSAASWWQPRGTAVFFSPPACANILLLYSSNAVYVQATKRLKCPDIAKESMIYWDFFFCSCTVWPSLKCPAVPAVPAFPGSSSSFSSTSSSYSWSSSSNSSSNSTTCSCSSNSSPSWRRDSLPSAEAPPRPQRRPREMASCWKSSSVNAACAKRLRPTGAPTKACASRTACPSSLAGDGHLSPVRLARHPARGHRPLCGTRQSEVKKWINKMKRKKKYRPAPMPLKWRVDTRRI